MMPCTSMLTACNNDAPRHSGQPPQLILVHFCVQSARLRAHLFLHPATIDTEKCVAARHATEAKQIALTRKFLRICGGGGRSIRRRYCVHSEEVDSCFVDFWVTATLAYVTN